MIDRIALVLKMLPAIPKLVKFRPDARITVADWVEARAQEHPERDFVRFEERSLSYGELNAAANRVSHWAYGQGLGHGDVVALLMENRPEYIATWAGLAKLGVTAALVNTNLRGKALAHALETADTRTLIVGSELLPAAAALADEVDWPLRAWVSRDPADETDPAAAPLPAGFRDLSAATDEEPDTDPDPSEREELRTGDNLFYIYTSGTTGLPKAARMSHLRFLGGGESTAFALKLRPGDVHYCALPLYHSAGGMMLVSSVLASGATIALRRKFSASQFWSDVREYGATHFQYIGEFCRYLVNQPPDAEDKNHRLRVAIGNGLRPDIWQEFQERFAIPRIIEFYGATEGNTVLINLENKTGSVGRFPLKALSNARLVRYDVENDTHVRGDDGLCIECGPDEPGELLGRIPDKPDGVLGRFEGYTSKEATDKKILRDVLAPGDAWFRSGDLLRQDAQGFFYFVDRIGDTFRWKGENVSTQEVAEILGGFPGLAMVNVYGVQVPGMDGRAGMAALVPEDPAAFEPTAFYRFVDEALARYAAPVFVRLLPEPDMTGTFKLRKVGLQQEGFDPGRVRDPLLVRDDEAGSYRPLTSEIAEEITRGERRL